MIEGRRARAQTIARAIGCATLALATIALATIAAPARAAAQADDPAGSGDATVATATPERGVVTLTRGDAPPGFALAVATAGDPETRVLCEPECALSVAAGAEVRVGMRRGDAVEWQHHLVAERDLRLDVRLVDRSALRGAGYALIVATGALLLATAIVGVATEPTPPELGWFGGDHALVFAGIAGGIVVALGVPGVALALAFERDDPAVEIVPAD